MIPEAGLINVKINDWSEKGEPVTIHTVNTREIRAKLRDVLDQVLKGEDVRVLRNGKPVAVLIPADDYDELVHELDDLRSRRRIVAVYREWKQDPSTVVPYSEVRNELITEGYLDD